MFILRVTLQILPPNIHFSQLISGIIIIGKAQLLYAPNWQFSYSVRYSACLIFLLPPLCNPPPAPHFYAVFDLISVISVVFDALLSTPRGYMLLSSLP